MLVAGRGSVEIPTTSGAIRLDDVLYLPGVTKNLLSDGSITDEPGNNILLFESKKVWVLKDLPLPEAHHIAIARKRDSHNGLYKF